MKNCFYAALIFWMAAAAGCTGRERYFPIGMYGVTKPAQLKVLKESGFDAFQSYRTEPALLAALAKEARRLSMKMVVSPYRVMKSTLSAEAGAWPVAAWYLEDEPGVHKTPVETLERKAAEVKAWAPAHLTTFVIGQGSPAAKYGHIGDSLMLDWYPVPHLGLETVAEQIDIALKGMKTADKPLWAVLQAFNWKDFPQRDRKKKRIGRFPDFYEIRFMTYSSIVHGARGIFYFHLGKPGLRRTLLDHPEEWQAVERVVWELKALKPMLERGSEIDFPFDLGPEGVEGRAWEYRGRTYAVVLNRTRKQLPLPEELVENPEWRPLFEVRRDITELVPSRKEPMLKPYRVFVVEKK